MQKEIGSDLFSAAYSEAKTQRDNLFNYTRDIAEIQNKIPSTLRTHIFEFDL